MASALRHSKAQMFDNNIDIMPIYFTDDGGSMVYGIPLFNYYKNI